MIENNIKKTFSYDLYLYKLVLLISIIIIPILIAAISNSITLSYAIGITCFILFVIVYNIKKANTSIPGKTKFSNELIERITELNILKNEVGELKMEIEKKNYEFAFLKTAIEQTQELTRKITETKHIQDRVKLVNDLNIFSRMYDDLSLRNKIYSDTFNLFIHDIKFNDKDYIKYRFFVELIQKLDEESKNLDIIKDKLKQDIESYLKE